MAFRRFPPPLLLPSEEASSVSVLLTRLELLLLDATKPKERRRAERASSLTFSKEKSEREKKKMKNKKMKTKKQNKKQERKKRRSFPHSQRACSFPPLYRPRLAFLFSPVDRGDNERGETKKNKKGFLESQSCVERKKFNKEGETKKRSKKKKENSISLPRFLQNHSPNL